MMILLNSFISQIGTSLILIAVFVTVISQSILEVNSYHHHQPAFISVRNYHRLTFASTTSRTTTTTINMGDDESNETSSISHPTRIKGDPHVKNVLFIECGFGNDSHGQSATKAAIRACRNAIEFNSIPSINSLVPNGYDGLKLDVLLAVPPKYKDSLDLSQVQEVFPYGSIRFQVSDGGMIAPSGIAIKKLGDTNQDMVVVCVAVTVGY